MSTGQGRSFKVLHLELNCSNVMFPGPSVGIARAGSVQYFPLHLLRPLLADSSVDPFEQPSFAAHPRTPFSTVRTADKAVNCCKQASHLVDVFYFRAIAQLSFPTLSFFLCATYTAATQQLWMDARIILAQVNAIDHKQSVNITIYWRFLRSYVRDSSATNATPQLYK